jgi:biopolymer transport protein ExbD
MNLRPDRPQRDPEINLTPLIDVVFLLLIFFMVSTTFDRTTQLEIELPEASAEPTEEEQELLEVSVDIEGRYYVNSKELVNTELETLKRALEVAADGRHELPLVIHADANSPHQAVVKIMDAASQLGLTRLTFAAQRPEGGG